MAAKRKISKKATAKKKSVKNLSQTHGKEEKFEPTTLDQIWGDTGMSKYKTLDQEVYHKHLKSLNKTDLQRHAAEVGIIPIDNKENLQKRLLGEFVKHTASYRIPRVKPPMKPLSQKAKDILAEGR